MDGFNLSRRKGRDLSRCTFFQVLQTRDMTGNRGKSQSVFFIVICANFLWSSVPHLRVLYWCGIWIFTRLDTTCRAALEVKSCDILIQFLQDKFGGESIYLGWCLHLQTAKVSVASEWFISLWSSKTKMVFGFPPKRRLLPFLNSECFTPGCIDFSYYCRSVRGNWIGNCRNTLLFHFWHLYFLFSPHSAFSEVSSETNGKRSLPSGQLNDRSDSGFSNNTFLRCKRLHSPLWF